MKARIGERASTGNGMRFKRGHVPPSDAVGPKSLLSRMGLDLGDAEIETVHEPASPSRTHPVASSQSDSLIRRLAIPASNSGRGESMSSKASTPPFSGTTFSSVSAAIFFALHGQLRILTFTPQKNDATGDPEKSRTDPGFSQLSATFDSLRSSVAPMINTVLSASNHFQSPDVTGPTSIHPPEQDPPRNPSPTRLSRLREALVPVIIKNAQSRPTTHPQNLDAEDVQARLREVLSDKTCEALREKMRSIQQQMLALNSPESASHPSFQTTVAGAGGARNVSDFAGMLSPSKLLAAITRAMPNDRPPLSRAMSLTSQADTPKAPRAMLRRQRSNRESDVSVNGAPPETLHSPAGNLTHHQDRNSHPNVPASTTSQASPIFTGISHDSPSRNEIAIPMDAAFFAAPSGKDETDADKRRSPPRRRSSRRSLSPVPSHRHSSPTPRRPSFHHRRSPSPRRPRSPLPHIPRGRSMSPRHRSPPRPPPTSTRSKRSRTRSRSPPPSYQHRVPLVRSPSPHLRRRHRSPSPRSRPVAARRRRSPYQAMDPTGEKRRARNQIIHSSVPARSPSPSRPEPSVVNVDSSHGHVQQPVGYSVTNDVALPDSSIHVNEHSGTNDVVLPDSSIHINEDSGTNDAALPNSIHINEDSVTNDVAPPDSSIHVNEDSVTNDVALPNSIHINEDSVTNDVALPDSFMHINEHGDVNNPLGPTLSPKRNIGPSTLGVPGLWVMQTGYDAARVLDCTFHVNDDIAEQWDLISPLVDHPREI